MTDAEEVSALVKRAAENIAEAGVLVAKSDDDDAMNVLLVGVITIFSEVFRRGGLDDAETEHLFDVVRDAMKEGDDFDRQFEGNA